MLYLLTPADYQAVQFYVGVADGPRNRRTGGRELVLEYRSSSTDRKALDAKLQQHTVVVEQDFIIRDELPGVFVEINHSTDSLTLDVGSGVILVFAASEDAYQLVSINGVPYQTGRIFRIGETDYSVREWKRLVLMYDEDNSMKVFRKRIEAEGRRIK